nr:reverse transcriptase domain-containing protein [Tanacetum cinerariifolium]
MELPSEDDLLILIKEISYYGKCDMLSTIQTDQMHQPWRTFAVVISRCISGISTGLDRLRESLIPVGMINDDIKLSKVYKTYLDYAIGKVPSKKAWKFKNPAFPKLKTNKAPAKIGRGKGIELISDAALLKETNSDDDENPYLTLKDYKEEEQDEENVLTLEKEKSDDEDKIYKEEYDDVEKELYGDLNITLGLRDTDMTNAEQGGEDQQNASHESGFLQEEEDAHVTLTTVHDKTEGIVDNYLASKIKEEVNVAVRLQSNKLKEEAKAENQELINQRYSTVKKIIKEQNPPYELCWKVKKVSDADGNLTTTTKRVFETYKNVTQDIRDQLNAEAEAVQIILTGINNDIYSTVDACLNACEMWKAINRLKQGESINVQDLETNLFWEFIKFTSQDAGLFLSCYLMLHALSDKLDDALWAFCIAYKTPIGCTPYKLVYGKAFHLHVELEHKAYWALKHANFDLKTAGDHRKVQINELNEIRDQAYENSLIYEKTKRLHDSKIKNRVFNIGTNKFGELGQASDPKQALHGRFLPKDFVLQSSFPQLH